MPARSVGLRSSPCIATVDDVIEIFKRLPNPDKRYSVLAGISHASFQRKNCLIVHHIVHALFTQPQPACAGSGAGSHA